MKPGNSLWLSAIFLLSLLAAFVWLRPQMPALVATHWNAQGQINLIQYNSGVQFTAGRS